MPTIDLGKIKLKWRGTWSSGGAYTIDDVVEYTDGSVTSSYIAVAASSNQAPSTGGTANSSYWNFLAKGQATSPTTTQGDLIVRGASADQRLAIGTAGQVLKVNSSANGLEYGGSGTYSIHKIQQYTHGSSVDWTGGRTDYIDIAGGNYLTFTPTSTDDILLFHMNCDVYCSAHEMGSTIYVRMSTSTSFNSNITAIRYNGQHSNYGRWYHMLHNRQTLMDCAGLTVGQNYYFEMAGASHAANSNQISFNRSNTNGESAARSFFIGIHYKKN